MEITEIKKIGKGQRYYLTMSDDRKFVIEAEVLVKNKLKTGQEFDEEGLKEILFENGDYASFDRALTYLEKGIQTEKGIREYLKRKGYLDESIDKTIEKLLEYGYINDEIYVENYIKTYGNRKGKKLLRFELLKKGVKQEIIDEKLENMFSFDDEKNTCIILAEKYLKSKEVDLKTRQKLFAYLMGKGFSSSVINEVIKELKCERE